MKTFETQLALDHYEEALEFVKEAMPENRMGEMNNDNILVFEELFVRAVSGEKGRRPNVIIKVAQRLGEVKISMGYSGNRFLLDFEQGDTLDVSNQIDPGSAILGMYSDKISLNYKRGYNTITLEAKKSNTKIMAMYFAIMVAAILVSIVLINTLTPEQCDFLNKKIIDQLDVLFGNALVMISTPIVFISLVKNITTVSSIVDHRFKIARTISRVIITSLISILTGVFIYINAAWLSNVLTGNHIVEFVGKDYMSTAGLAKAFLHIVPSSLAGAFGSKSPFPLILLAFIVSGAICISGRHFHTLKMLTDAIYTLFSKMMTVIMMFLPIFFFIAIVDRLIEGKMLYTLINYLYLVGLVVIGILLISIVFCLRILASGGNPVYIMRTLLPAIRVNLRINSSIDAVPYNIRFCHKAFGSPIDRLGVNIPILAQISQSGNCYFTTFLTLEFCILWNIPMSFSKLLMVGLMAFVFSIGAPGQPGSVLIGVIMMTTFMGLSPLNIMPILIITEVLFGSILNLMNTVDDLVEVAIEEMSNKRKIRKRNKKL